MKASNDKYHFIVSNNQHVSIKIHDVEAKIRESEKQLGIKID